MKSRYLSIIVLVLSLISFSSFSQTENDEPLLGLPGDNLDLYAVLDLFQKSKTIEDFEKSLNEEKTGINNLDLNDDGKIDFIKVVTEKDGDNFLFILQDPISEKEIQDVAVITVSKDTAGKVSMQIIGDKELYGKDYVVEPRIEPTESVTANPAYTGDDPVTVNVQASTEVIVVESTPIVQHVYSPTYVPYSSPYHYGYYPRYWVPFAVIGIGIYRHNHWHRHHGYRGGHSSVNINVNNRNTYNNYNKNKRNTSNTVNRNVKNGNFNTAGKGGSRPSTSQAGRASNGASNRASTRPSNSQAGRTRNSASSNNRASTSPTKSQSRPSSKGTSTSNRSTSPRSSNRSTASSPSRSAGSSRSSGPSRSAGARGGGGRRR